MAMFFRGLIWFMHCHLERHSSWGMSGVVIVKNGEGSDENILPPRLISPIVRRFRKLVLQPSILSSMKSTFNVVLDDLSSRSAS
jgi:hypothetical protein